MADQPLTAPLAVPEALWPALRFAWPRPATDGGYVGAPFASQPLPGHPLRFTQFPGSNAPPGTEAWTLAVTIVCSAAIPADTFVLWDSGLGNSAPGMQAYIGSGTFVYAESPGIGQGVPVGPPVQSLGTYAGAVSRLCLTRTQTLAVLYWQGRAVTQWTALTSWQVTTVVTWGVDVTFSSPFSLGTLRDVYIFTGALSSVQVAQLTARLA
jgi:hypothetical protein